MAGNVTLWCPCSAAQGSCAAAFPKMIEDPELSSATVGRKWRSVACALCIATTMTAILSGQAYAASAFRDSLDGAFDISNWLSTRFGFVPIASIITEPAVGLGVAGGLMFMHQSYAEARATGSPPSISGVGGLLTENGTWGAFVFHQGYYRQDTVRYRGYGGYAAPQLSVYRELPPPIGTLRFGFNMEGWLLGQELSWRLFGSPVFLGVDYQLFTSDVSFDFDKSIPDSDPAHRSLQISGLGPLVTYDSRDNTFTPNRGIRSRLLYRFHDEFLGSDRRFHRLEWLGLAYTDHWESVVIGVRGDMRFTGGETPFYALPYVDLRGIPAMRYQGDQIYVVESQVRWDFNLRWSLVGFGGYGHAVMPSGPAAGGENAWAAGSGFRYLIARPYGIRAGLDVARGPEEWAVYVQFGSAWSRY